MYLSREAEGGALQFRGRFAAINNLDLELMYAILFCTFRITDLLN